VGFIETAKEVNQMDTIQVIRADHPDGAITINKSDFDPKIHKIPGEKKRPAPKKKTRRAK